MMKDEMSLFARKAKFRCYEELKKQSMFYNHQQKHWTVQLKVKDNDNDGNLSISFIFHFIYLGTVVLSVHKNYFSRGCGTEIQHTRDETETEIWGRMERIIMLWCNALIAGISNGTLEHFGGAKLADSLESNLSQIWNTPKLCQMIFAGWNCLWNFWQ